MVPNSVFRTSLLVCVALTGCGGEPEEHSTSQAGTAPDQPTWPPGGLDPSAALGYLPGEANVSRNGEAQYSIPLEVPPGRMGMQPALSLEYSNNGPNGLMGVGWGFTGFSQITPCSKNWSTEAVADGVDWDDTDVYCLDGQKLVVASIFDGTKRKFRTERESWADVVAEYPNGNGAVPPIKFTVRGRDGRTSTYLPHTAFVYPISGVAVDTPVVWLIDKTRDRAGNAMTYTYEEDKQVSYPWPYASRPSKITYTVDDAAPTAPGDRYVMFEYEDRSAQDKPFAYSSGLRNTIEKRLKSVKMYAPMDPSKPAELAWRYDIKYRTSNTTMRQIVDSVKQCDAKGVCKWAKQFKWASDNSSLANVQVTTTTIDDHVHETETAMDFPYAMPAGLSKLVVGDFDNDGKDDVIYWDSVLVEQTLQPVLEWGHIRWRAKIRLSSSGPLADEYLVGSTTANIMGEENMIQTIGPFHGVSLAASRVVDLDGDGVQELYFATNPGNDTEYAVHRWDNSKKVFQALENPVKHRKVDFVDLDGDGLMDLIEVINDQWHVRLNDASKPGTFLAAVNTGVIDRGEDENPQTTDDCKDLSSATDVDGDGRGDYLVAGFPCGQVTRIYTNDDGVLQSAPQLIPVLPPESLSNLLLRFADRNGDGLGDLLVAGTVSVNTGHGFLSVPPDIGFGNKSTDVNNDGRMDLFGGAELVPDSHISLSTSSPTAPADFISVTIPNAHLAEIGDFDGDGVQEFIGLTEQVPAAGKARRLRLHKIDLSQTSDVITEVQDEGASHPRETFTYARTWSEKPTAQTCTYPQQCMKRGMQVVRALKTSQGESLLPNGQVTKYSYDKPRRDVRGRGFLGFAVKRTIDPLFGEHTTVTDNATRIHIAGHDIYPMATVSTTDMTPIFDQPESGTIAVPSSFRTKIVTTTPVSETVTTVPVAYLTRQKSWTVKEEEQDATLTVDGIKLGANKITTKTHTGIKSNFDAYNNPKFIDENTVGGETTHQQLIYVNDATNWILGQLTRSEDQAWENGALKPLARIVEHEYYPNGLLFRTTREPEDTGSLYQQTELTRGDDRGLVTATTTRVKSGQPNHVETVKYDPQGIYPQLRQNAEGHWSWVVYYPAFGKPRVTMDPNLVLTTYSYDGFGRPTQVKPTGGIVTTTSYKAVTAAGFNTGIETTQSGNDNSQSAQITDEHDRVVTNKGIAFDGTLAVSDTRYNLLGVATSESRPGLNAPSAFYRTTWTYDTLGRPRKTVTPDSQTTENIYTTTATTRSIKTTDPDGRISTKVSNVDDRPTRQDESAPGGTISTWFAYWPWGQLKTVTDPKSNVVSSEFDKIGRRTKLTDPDIGVTNYTYTGFDEIKTEATTLQTRTYWYDKLSRQIEIVDFAGSTVWNWDSAPHAIGSIWRTQSPQGVVITRDFDTLGRVIKETTSVPTPATTFAVWFKYDGYGRISETHLPGASGLVDPAYLNTYNTWGYLSSRSDLNGGLGGWKWTATERELDGALRKEVQSTVETTTTHVPATGKVNQITAKNTANSATLLSLGYTYFAGGNVKTRSDSVASRSESYEYDGLNRLWKWTLGASSTFPMRLTQYAFDDLGNLTKVTVNGGTVDTLVYGGTRPHAVMTMNGQALAYDAMGRQFDGPRRTVNTFTPFNLPKKITDKQGAGAVDYLYDADNVRTRKTSAAGAETIYVGGRYERRKTTTGTSHVFYLPGESAAVAQFVKADGANGALQYMVGDKQGTVSVVLSSLLAVQERRFTEPFGGAVAANGAPTVAATSAVTRGFTGHEMENELGLINMRGRMYDPAQRRFLTPDPIVQDVTASQTFNRYSYVWNNPTAFIDPTGYQGKPDDDSPTNDEQPPEIGPFDDGSGWIKRELLDQVTSGWTAENKGSGEAPVSSTDQGPTTPSATPADHRAEEEAEDAAKNPSLDPDEPWSVMDQRNQGDQKKPWSLIDQRNEAAEAGDLEPPPGEQPGRDGAGAGPSAADHQNIMRDLQRPTDYSRVWDRATTGAEHGEYIGNVVGLVAGGILGSGAVAGMTAGAGTPAGWVAGALAGSEAGERFGKAVGYVGGLGYGLFEAWSE